MAEFGGATAVGLRIEGIENVIWAEPRPQDLPQLLELLDGRPVAVTVATADDDTDGHWATDEITLDVEGHAITLRLPTPNDAAVLRRRLLVTAATATLVVAGSAAALQGIGNPGTTGGPAAGPGAGAVPAQHAQMAPLSDIGLADRAAGQAAQDFAGARGAQAAQPAPAAVDTSSDVGLADGAAGQAAQDYAGTRGAQPAPAAADTSSDVGLADGAAGQAAQNYAGTHADGASQARPSNDFLDRKDAGVSGTEQAPSGGGAAPNAPTNQRVGGETEFAD